MLRLACLFLPGWILFTAPAGAQTLDPDGLIRPALLAEAVEAMEVHSADDPALGALVVVDYSLHSSKERLFVIDLKTGAVSAFRTAHGLGSDPDHDGYLDSFSGKSGSQASPEGMFRLAEEYYGKHGQSFRLDGLDAANGNSRARAIVVHSTWYAEPAFLRQHGKLGRSNGCIVFSAADLARFIEAAPEGSLIYAGK